MNKTKCDDVDFIREVDKIIHQFYCQHDNYQYVNYGDHSSNQNQIIDMLKKKTIDIKLFNDPSVFYPEEYSRPHFNGETGTMSNILTSCFFNLYFYLLGEGINVNPENDLRTLFCLVFDINNNDEPYFQMVDGDRKKYVNVKTKQIPENEKRLIQLIIYTLQTMRPSLHNWWETQVIEMEERISFQKKREFWDKFPSNRRDAIMPKWYNLFQHYDYFPDYIVIDHNVDDNGTEIIRKMREFNQFKL